MALFTFGEGYHNYHHEFQHDYRNGPKLWNWDPTKWIIWSLAKFRLVSGLRRVSKNVIQTAESRTKSNHTQTGSAVDVSLCETPRT